MYTYLTLGTESILIRTVHHVVLVLIVRYALGDNVLLVYVALVWRPACGAGRVACGVWLPCHTRSVWAVRRGRAVGAPAVRSTVRALRDPSFTRLNCARYALAACGHRFLERVCPDINARAKPEWPSLSLRHVTGLAASRIRPLNVPSRTRTCEWRGHSPSLRRPRRASFDACLCRNASS